MLKKKSVEVLEVEIANKKDIEDIRDIEELNILIIESVDELKTIENWERLAYLSYLFLSAFFYIKSFARRVQVDNNALVYTLQERWIVLNYNAIFELIF